MPASVRLQALATASKCLGLQRENVEPVADAKVIIQPKKYIERPPGLGQTPPVPGQPRPAQGTKAEVPISIVR